MKEQYDILGVKYDAQQEEIKSVFRKLSKIYHPDVPDTGNEQLFKKINNAYKNIEKNNFIFSEGNGFEYKNRHHKSWENNSQDYYHNVTMPIKLILFIWSLILRIYQRYGWWIILFIIFYPIGIILFILEFFRRNEDIDYERVKKKKEWYKYSCDYWVYRHYFGCNLCCYWFCGKKRSKSK